MEYDTQDFGTLEDYEREKLEAIVSWNPHSPLLGPLSSARAQRTPLTPGDSASFSTVNTFHLAPPNYLPKILQINFSHPEYIKKLAIWIQDIFELTSLLRWQIFHGSPLTCL